MDVIAPSRSAPASSAQSRETQSYGTLVPVPIGLGENARAASVAVLNQLLADTMVLRDLYKKHHWQTTGPTFYQLHLLYDKHYGEQLELMDALAERVMSLGGVSLAVSHDIAEETLLPRPPRGRESVPDQLQRLLAAHEQILAQARKGAREAADNGDDGTHDLVVSQIIRTNEMQVWFLAEHVGRAEAG